MLEMSENLSVFANFQNKVASSRFFAVDERDDRREEERDDLQQFFSMC